MSTLNEQEEPAKQRDWPEIGHAALEIAGISTFSAGFGWFSPGFGLISAGFGLVVLSLTLGRT